MLERFLWHNSCWLSIRTLIQPSIQQIIRYNNNLHISPIGEWRQVNRMRVFRPDWALGCSYKWLNDNGNLAKSMFWFELLLHHQNNSPLCTQSILRLHSTSHIWESSSNPLICFRVPIRRLFKNLHTYVHAYACTLCCLRLKIMECCSLSENKLYFCHAPLTGLFQQSIRLHDWANSNHTFYAVHRGRVACQRVGQPLQFFCYGFFAEHKEDQCARELETGRRVSKCQSVYFSVIYFLFRKQDIRQFVRIFESHHWSVDLEKKIEMVV